MLVTLETSHLLTSASKVVSASALRALLNVFFYLDKRRIALELCLLFVLLNTVLTLVTLYLGPTFFGYGFTVSLIVCVLAGLVRLNGALQKLEYSTFMLEH